MAEFLITITIQKNMFQNQQMAKKVIEICEQNIPQDIKKENMKKLAKQLESLLQKQFPGFFVVSFENSLKFKTEQVMNLKCECGEDDEIIDLDIWYTLKEPTDSDYNDDSNDKINIIFNTFENNNMVKSIIEIVKEIVVSFEEEDYQDMERELQDELVAEFDRPFRVCFSNLNSFRPHSKQILALQFENEDALDLIISYDF